MIITLDLTTVILAANGEPMEGGALTLGALLHFALRTVPQGKQEKPAELRKRSKLTAQVANHDFVLWDENTLAEVVAHCEALFCQGDIQPLLQVYQLTEAATAAAAEAAP